MLPLPRFDWLTSNIRAPFTLMQLVMQLWKSKSHDKITAHSFQWYLFKLVQLKMVVNLQCMQHKKGTILTCPHCKSLYFYLRIFIPCACLSPQNIADQWARLHTGAQELESWLHWTPLPSLLHWHDCWSQGWQLSTPPHKYPTNRNLWKAAPDFSMGKNAKARRRQSWVSRRR